MRMELYEVRLDRPDGEARSYVVAPSEPRAAELVIDHHLATNQECPDFPLQRVDEDLPQDRQKGLDALLDTAPVGFASYHEPIGWIAHIAAVEQLRLFRLEDEHGASKFVIAPDKDTAMVIYCADWHLEEGEQRMFRIYDGLAELPPERLRNLPDLLEFGPAGIVAFDEGNGWSAV